MQLNFEILRMAAVLIGTLLAAEQDRRTSFIDGKITYSMIGAGIILNVLSLDASLIAFALGGAAIIFAFGYGLYKYGKLGGADVLLFCGIHLLLPYPPAGVQDWFWQTFLPSHALEHQVINGLSGTLPLVADVFISSSMMALVGSAVLYATKMRGRKLKPDPMSALTVFGAGVVLAYLLNLAGFLSTTHLLPMIFTAILFLAAALLMIFQKQIMEEVIAQKIPVSKIEDEDVILIERMDPKIVEKYKVEPVATKEELKKLKTIGKTEGVRAFPVAKELPRLGPYILMALVLTMLFGNLIAAILLF